MLGTGEGAVSTGAMVPIYDARDVGAASQVAELLEAHAIPAIVDADLAGVTGLAPRDTPCVYVPSSMLPAAKAILQDAREGGEQVSSELSALLTWVPAKVVETEVAPPLREDAPPPFVDVHEEEDEGPLEAPLPDPGPLRPRLMVALTAIVFGLILQRGLELALGARGAVTAMAASMASLEHPWSFVTAGFAHGSFGHMLSNAAFGILIGTVLFGTHRVGATAFVWLVGSIVGIGAELALSPEATVLGASAGNYALVGLWAHGQLERARLAPLPRRERLRTLGVLLLLVPGAFTPFSSSGSKVAVLAHGVGFVVGLSLGLGFSRRLEPEGFDRVRVRSRVAGWIAGLATLGATSALLLDTLL